MIEPTTITLATLLVLIVFIAYMRGYHDAKGGKPPQLLP